MCAMQGGSLYHFYDGSLVWPGREANSRPTVWGADMLTTQPTRHGGPFVDWLRMNTNETTDDNDQFFVFCLFFAASRSWRWGILEPVLVWECDVRTGCVYTHPRGRDTSVTRGVTLKPRHALLQSGGEAGGRSRKQLPNATRTTDR